MSKLRRTRAIAARAGRRSGGRPLLVAALGAAAVLTVSLSWPGVAEAQGATGSKGRAPSRGAAPAAGRVASRAATIAVPPPPSPVDAAKAMEHVRALERFGVKAAGSEAERAAGDYIAGQLKALGYEPKVVEVPLPNGRVSRNVVARRQGASDRVLVLGAHMDSKPPSPGANDNATGCAALLEIARSLADQRPYATVELVFFGAEETIDGNPDHHHYGSRAHVAALTPDERRRIAGMISVDMIGVGPDFVMRTMGRGPRGLADHLIARARRQGLPAQYLPDRGRTGWSDHEAFELAGIPSVWVEWRDDPVYHTAKDTSGHIDPEHVRVTAQFVLDFVLTADEPTLAGLR